MQPAREFCGSAAVVEPSLLCELVASQLHDVSAGYYAWHAMGSPEQYPIRLIQVFLALLSSHSGWMTSDTTVVTRHLRCGRGTLTERDP